PPPRVFAHRGFAREAPENTLLAFAKALATGASYLETDVHESSDGIAIVSHDPTLERVAARKVRVNNLTAAELRRVDLGHGQCFSSLEQALDAFPEARFNIDVKSSGAVQGTIDAIRSTRALNRVLVSSFSGRIQRATVQGLPGVATSAPMGAMVRLLSTSNLRFTGRVLSILTKYDALQIPERYKGIRVLSPRLIRLAHEVGTEVHVWTVNEPDDMNRLLDLGVDGIVTDRADVALTVLRTRRS
ncbi:MAG: glycerophosphodiester phosphodiesterase, partial [Terrimesophilobacter sp.]